MQPRLLVLTALLLSATALTGCVTEPAGNETNATADTETPPLTNVTKEVVELGTVTLAAGHPITYHTGETIPGEDVDVSQHNGWTLHTKTTDNGGIGYDIDLYLLDDGGAQMQACEKAGDDEADCEVPDGAAAVRINSYIGADLEVTVYATSP